MFLHLIISTNNLYESTQDMLQIFNKVVFLNLHGKSPFCDSVCTYYPVTLITQSGQIFRGQSAPGIGSCALGPQKAINEEIWNQFDQMQLKYEKF